MLDSEAMNHNKSSKTGFLIIFIIQVIGRNTNVNPGREKFIKIFNWPVKKYFV